MERSVDIILHIDGIVLNDENDIDEIIQKIDKITDTIYPITYEIVNEEYYED